MGVDVVHILGLGSRVLESGLHGELSTGARGLRSRDVASLIMAVAALQIIPWLLPELKDLFNLS